MNWSFTCHIQITYSCCCFFPGVLIGLLTLEIQSYGPESLAGSKVVEFLHVSALSNAASSLPFAGPNTVGPPASGPLMGPAPGQPMGPPARPPPLPVIGGIRPPQAGTEAQMVAPSMPPSGVFALPRKFCST
jgi:hypothetical protein